MVLDSASSVVKRLGRMGFSASTRALAHSFRTDVFFGQDNCFAGCGSGSVIDFWMKWKGCEFTEAVKELADGTVSMFRHPAQEPHEATPMCEVPLG